MIRLVECDFEVVPEPTMAWYCYECKTKFQGPTKGVPKEGCPNCKSKQVIDLNIDLSKAVFLGGSK